MALGTIGYAVVTAVPWGWAPVVLGALAVAALYGRFLRRLRFDANHDDRTGLLNRSGFLRYAAAAAARRRRAAVLRVDLDVLSTVADALGHAWGDHMVVAAAARIRGVLASEVTAPAAVVARLDGGRFAAMLPGCEPEQVYELGRSLREALSKPYPVERLTVEASATVGYVCVDVDDASGAGTWPPDVDVLLQRADLAARSASSSGEDVRRYSPSMGQMFLRRFQLVTQFRHALRSGEVEVHYQPKIALPGRQVLGAEALVRWKHPEFGRLDPDEFVPAVEATGLVDALTEFVTDRSLAHVRTWADLGIRISASVNLSVRNLSDEDFPERVRAALARYDLPPQALTYELTESGVMADPERALPVLTRLHALGVRLAVDDFGTGYSSLAYLRTLPVDEVKIDKSFVLGMATSLGDLAVVRATVELGHSLGLTVVAEGVEGDEVREQLIAMGCDVAQGYLIARPLAEDRFAAWIQARTTLGRSTDDTVVMVGT